MSPDFASPPSLVASAASRRASASRASLRRRARSSSESVPWWSGRSRHRSPRRLVLHRTDRRNPRRKLRTADCRRDQRRHVTAGRIVPKWRHVADRCRTSPRSRADSEVIAADGHEHSQCYATPCRQFTSGAPVSNHKPTQGIEGRTSSRQRHCARAVESWVSEPVSSKALRAQDRPIQDRCRHRICRRCLSASDPDSDTTKHRCR